MTVRLGSESVVNFHKALTRGTLPRHFSVSKTPLLETVIPTTPRLASSSRFETGFLSLEEFLWPKSL